VEIQEWSGLRAEAEIDLYEGRGAWTRARMRGDLEGIGRSLLVRAQIIRTEYDWLVGRLALAEAEGAEGAAGRGEGAEGARSRSKDAALRDASRAARSLERQDVAYGRAWAELLRAAIARLRGGDRAEGIDAACAHLREAIVASEAASLGLCAAVARRRLGALIGGVEGANLVEAGEARMRQEGIVDVVAMSRLVAPGFVG
jgi:hypothetical protein